ncbi:MAG TPA: EthD domain-containing protein [Alphaproteobacteria bacterium]|jgi:uncharacterized protein (TIGR02118 family)|nr:EthD domain-containing protein [Alphaproteobacteria bacterium]
MIKLAFCLRRLPHLSVEEFQRTWREDHAPLVRQHQKALGILRYVQLHTDHGALTEGLTASRGCQQAYDGIAELWYESREAVAALRESSEARAAGKALYEDECRFIDLANSAIWVGEEHEVIASE